MAAMQQQPLSKTTDGRPPLSTLRVDDSLKGKAVIITGGTSGLGRCIAIACARAGARGILITGRNATHGEETLTTIAREVVAAHGPSGVPSNEICARAFVAVDLADGEAAATKIMDAAVREFGTVDLLVNSAAACFPRGDLETTTPELWDTMMSTNVKAPFLLTQALARHLKQRRARGAVVNIGSCAAHGGAPFILAYSCSKAALACFTKNTAAELRPHGIRVNQVNMGWCLTDAEDRGQSATNRFWLAEADAASPSGRILRPEDTAASVVHLLSESASMVTGAILDISPDMLPGIMSGETCC
jgi:NAD(P)-dependent dehydrogenase (short-subunit alcohol dehydrogenase family)